jgi:hypothetical protein
MRSLGLGECGRGSAATTAALTATLFTTMSPDVPAGSAAVAAFTAVRVGVPPFFHDKVSALALRAVTELAAPARRPDSFLSGFLLFLAVYAGAVAPAPSALSYTLPVSDTALHSACSLLGSAATSSLPALRPLALVARAKLVLNRPSITHKLKTAPELPRQLPELLLELEAATAATTTATATTTTTTRRSASSPGPRSHADVVVVPPDFLFASKLLSEVAAEVQQVCAAAKAAVAVAAPTALVAGDQ